MNADFGEGDWSIVVFDGYKVTSLSNGYYKYNESIYVCQPLWQNDTKTTATLILGIQQTNTQSINLVNSLQSNLSRILDDRLDIEIKFANIQSLSQILGYNVSFSNDSSSRSSFLSFLFSYSSTTIDESNFTSNYS